MADTGWQEPQGGIVQCMICGERFKSIEESENHPHFTETEIETGSAEVEMATQKLAKLMAEMQTTAYNALISAKVISGPVDATYLNLIRPIRTVELSFMKSRSTYRNSEFGFRLVKD